MSIYTCRHTVLIHYAVHYCITSLLKVGLNRKDAHCQSKWSVGVNQTAAELR